MKTKKKGRKPIGAKLLKEHHNQCVARYNKEHNRCLSVRFNVETDKEIWGKLDSVENKADYIRQLIKNDIKK